MSEMSLDLVLKFLDDRYFASYLKNKFYIANCLTSHTNLCKMKTISVFFSAAN